MDNHNRRKVLKADLQAGHGLAGAEWRGLARTGVARRGRQGAAGKGVDGVVRIGRRGLDRTGPAGIGVAGKEGDGGDGPGLVWLGRAGLARRGLE